MPTNADMPSQPQEYTGLKKRCEHCGRTFREGDLIALKSVHLPIVKMPYDLVFCFGGGNEFRCIGPWQVQYNARLDFICIPYKGRGRSNSGGNTGRFPALI